MAPGLSTAMGSMAPWLASLRGSRGSRGRSRAGGGAPGSARASLFSTVVWKAGWVGLCAGERFSAGSAQAGMGELSYAWNTCLCIIPVSKW